MLIEDDLIKINALEARQPSPANSEQITCNIYLLATLGPGALTKSCLLLSNWDITSRCINITPSRRLICSDKVRKLFQVGQRLLIEFATYKFSVEVRGIQSRIPMHDILIIHRDVIISRR